MVAAGLQHVGKAYDITIDVGLRIDQTVADPRLGG